MQYKKEYEEQLSKYGVDYFRTLFYLDASIRGDNVRQFDTLIISYKNYDKTGYGPWRDDLDRYLRPVWMANDDKGLVSAIYKVELNQ